MVLVIVENIIEPEVGVVNGTIQALRNLVTGLILNVWWFSITYNTVVIVRKLGGNQGKVDPAAKAAQNHLMYNVYVIGAGCFIGFAVKFLSFFGAVGKTLYARPPCEGDGMFHFNHAQVG